MKKKVFMQQVKMATDTIFSTDGAVQIFPAFYDSDQHLLSHPHVSRTQCGRLRTQDDGTSCFTPYQRTEQPRYQTLMTTPHGSLRETRENLILTVRLPKRLAVHVMAAIYRQESAELYTYLNEMEDNDL